MKRLTRVLSFLVALALIIGTVPTAVFGVGQSGGARTDEGSNDYQLVLRNTVDKLENLEVTIATVYGGAKGIVSMTYDDGNYASALVIEELCEKYDLEASLMLIAERMKNADGTLTPSEKWVELFDKGYLEPQNHSMSHMGFRKDYENPKTGAKDNDNMTPENYKSEILDSKELLEECFHDYDFICYAIPHGGWCVDALNVAAPVYYMIRSTARGKQSLDPSTELGVTGSWSRLYSPTVTYVKGEGQLEYLKSEIDTAAEGYWYCPIAHVVGDFDGAEIPLEVLDAWYKYIAEVRDRGDIWVTTASAATKYIRERQNSTARVSYEGGKLTVKVDMASVTADGLPLDKSVFDQPLTLKVQLPEGYSRVAYSIGGECRVADSFSEGGVTYAFVDVIPDSREVTLTSVDESYKAHKLESVAATAPTCMALGNVEHERCTVCGVCFDAEGKRLRSVELPLGEHTLTSVAFKPTSCTEDGTIMHKHCEVCLKNFDSNMNELEKVTVSKKGHTMKPIEGAPATEESEGILAHNQCIFCGMLFDGEGNALSSVTIPKLSTNNPGVIFAIAAAGGTVTLAGGFSVYWFVLRKKRI